MICCSLYVGLREGQRLKSWGGVHQRMTVRGRNEVFETVLSTSLDALTCTVLILRPPLLLTSLQSEMARQEADLQDSCTDSAPTLKL